MIRANDFAQTNREDDLLKRLKQCVGSIETASKDHSKIPSSRDAQVFASKQLFSREALDEKKFESRPSYRHSLGNKQNLTEKKCHARQQDFRKLSTDKENCDILKMTKNYLETTRQNVRSYQTDRKVSLPLGQMPSFSNAKRQLFTKQVSDSTKKRIAERESLINGESDKITPTKLPQKPKNKALNEDQFLQRLSLRKISYLDHSNPPKEGNSLSTRNFQHIRGTQIVKNSQSLRKEKSFIQQNESSKNLSIQERPRQQPEVVNLPKYENYSKIAMENLVKDQDLRKAQKMQKLKKITNMNEEINKKIRKIVDTFENYLTHRQV